jgi:hypothetical protein
MACATKLRARLQTWMVDYDIQLGVEKFFSIARN